MWGRPRDTPNLETKWTENCEGKMQECRNVKMQTCENRKKVFVEKDKNVKCKNRIKLKGQIIIYIYILSQMQRFKLFISSIFTFYIFLFFHIHIFWCSQFCIFSYLHFPFSVPFSEVGLTKQRIQKKSFKFY